MGLATGFRTYYRIVGQVDQPALTFQNIPLQISPAYAAEVPFLEVILYISDAIYVQGGYFPRMPFEHFGDLL